MGEKLFSEDQIAEDQKIVLEKDGKEKEYDVLFTFDCEDTMKSYIGYTDHSYGANGRKNIFVASIDPLKPDLSLEQITDEAELQMINDVLVQFDNECKNS